MACGKCEDNGGYTVRVTGGHFDGAHESEYACGNCIYVVVTRILASFPHVEVHPLRELKRAIADLHKD